MYAFQFCNKYQKAINSGQFDLASEFFATNASIMTPIRGSMNAIDYHKQLVHHAKHGVIRLRNVFQGLNDTPSVAQYLHYTWILKTGKFLEFNGVDIYEFMPDLKKFSNLTIIYDTAPLRKYLTEEQIATFSSGRL
jgi:hypothetical protein